MAKSPIYVLDIGSYSLKLLALDLSKKPPKVLRLEKLPIKVQSNGKINLKKDIEEIFSSVPKRDRKNISVILSSNTIFTRYVNLPNIPRSKIKQIISFEAEQQIPFILEEVTWDYAVITQEGDEDLHVVISAIRNKEIEEVYKIFKRLHISIKSFGLAQLSHMNLARFCKFEEKNFIVIDLGHGVTNIIVIEGKKGWARNIPIGGSRLGSEDPHTLDISMPEVKKFLARLLDETKRTFSFYASFAEETKIEKIYLTGGLSQINNLASVFSEELNLPVECLDVSKYFSARRSLRNTFKEENCYYQAALGFALVAVMKNPLSINLLPQEEKTKRELERLKTKFFAFAFTVFCFLGVLFFNMFYQINLKTEKNQAAREKLEYYQEFSKHIQKIETQIQTYDNMLEIIQQKNKNRYLFHAALKRIVKELPENIWFHAISLDQDGGMTLSGICTGTLADINYYKNSLEKEALFKSIKIDRADIAVEETAEAQPKRTFTLRILLR